MAVILAKAGIHCFQEVLDPRVKPEDDDFLIYTQTLSQGYTMNEISMITAALSAQQSATQTKIAMAVLKNALQADQAIAQILMESIKAGETVINSSGSGSIDLYV
ncbi:MAG: hypothetical protein C0402_04630 [Thermodesulfovibrio sp.]|nr:hypothetical protein [Thermodesulfovibrio sp.]